MMLSSEWTLNTLVKYLFREPKGFFTYTRLGKMRMAKMFPFRSEVDIERRNSRILNLEEAETDAVFDALASETSRAIYNHLYDQPSTASDIADEVDTSVQNVRYHLEKLSKAGLIEEVDTWYSSRGNEMSVYAATDEALVLAGDRFQNSELKTAIEGVIGAVIVLAGVSLILDWVILELFSESVRVVETAEIVTTQGGLTTESGIVATSPLDFAERSVLNLRPGILVFLGGIFTMAGLMAVQVARRRLRDDS